VLYQGARLAGHGEIEGDRPGVGIEAPARTVSNNKTQGLRKESRQPFELLVRK